MFRRIVLGAFLLILAPALASARTGTVLVFPFDNESNDKNLDWIGEGISELIIDRLQFEPDLYVFQRDERLLEFEKLGLPETATVSRATAMKVGWNSGADWVITGRFDGTAARFDIYARIVDLASSGSSQEIKVSGKLDDIIPLTSVLSGQVLKLIVPATHTPESDSTAQPPIRRSAFENYVRGILVRNLKRRTEYLDAAIRLVPNYPSALFQLGRVKYLEGDFKASNQRLEKITSGDPSYSYAQFIIGLNSYRVGDYARAASVFYSLPQTYDVSIDLGAAEWGKGEALNAVAIWRRAAALDPLAAEAPFNLGYILYLKGDFDGSAKALEKVLRLQGRDSEAMFLLARVYEKLGRTEESQKLMAQAIRYSPRVERWLTQPLPKLERLRTRPNIPALRTEAAFNIWTQDRLNRRAKGRDLTPWLDYVQKQIDAQSFGEALRELRMAIQVYPSSSDTHLLWGQIDERQKNYDEAISEYDLCIRMRPSADAYVGLARAQRALNHNTLAQRALNEALRLDPQNPAALALKTELQKSLPRKHN